jgi:hypothetical protein
MHQHKKHDPYEIDNMEFDNMTLMSGLKRPPYPVGEIFYKFGSLFLFSINFA